MDGEQADQFGAHLGGGFASVADEGAAILCNPALKIGDGRTVQERAGVSTEHGQEPHGRTLDQLIN